MGKKMTIFLAAVGTAILILDTQTAMLGAKEGLDLCLRTVIPSLFPFFILSGILTSSLLDARVSCLSGLLKHLGIPQSAVSLLGIGFLGGYPVGAQAVANAMKQGALSKTSAKRMIAFCNNAGPSFLFGIVAPAFAQRWACWAIWCILIISSLLVAYFLPEKETDQGRKIATSSLSLPAAMNRALKAMANVCGWVILFRVVIRVFDRWLLWMMPNQPRIMICGILELSNGCAMLRNITSTGSRLIMAALFLSFGGICVPMQTASAVSSAGLSLTHYFPGKSLQAALSMGFAYLLQMFLPIEDQTTAEELPFYGIVFVLFLAFAVIFMYNHKKTENRRWMKCCFAKKLPALANTANMQL